MRQELVYEVHIHNFPKIGIIENLFLINILNIQLFSINNIIFPYFNYYFNFYNFYVKYKKIPFNEIITSYNEDLNQSAHTENKYQRE